MNVSDFSRKVKRPALWESLAMAIRTRGTQEVALEEWGMHSSWRDLQVKQSPAGIGDGVCQTPDLPHRPEHSAFFRPDHPFYFCILKSIHGKGCWVWFLFGFVFKLLTDWNSPKL